MVSYYMATTYFCKELLALMFEICSELRLSLLNALDFAPFHSWLLLLVAVVRPGHFDRGGQRWGMHQARVALSMVFWTPANNQ